MTHALFHPALLFKAGAVLLALAATSGSNSNPVDSHPPRAAIEGSVLNVGRDSIALEETATKAMWAFVVAPYAAIEKDGVEVPLARIRPGDLARVLSDSDGREYKAITITAQTPPNK